MDEARNAARIGGAPALAARIAEGWIAKMGPAEWVAVGGADRRPVRPGAEACVKQLEGGPGVAFVLAAAGVADLLFVVRPRAAAFQVSISDNVRPWDPSERHHVRPGYSTDMQGLLDAAAKYARRAAAQATKATCLQGPAQERPAAEPDSA